MRRLWNDLSHAAFLEPFVARSVLERFILAASLERVAPTQALGTICSMQLCWDDSAEGSSFFLELVFVFSRLISHLVTYLLTY